MTDVALKEHLEGQIEALRREVSVQREADLRAIDLARGALAARLETMNEFRAQILEERGNYVRVDTFRWSLGLLIALIGVVTTLISVLMR